MRLSHGHLFVFLAIVCACEDTSGAPPRPSPAPTIATPPSPSQALPTPPAAHERVARPSRDRRRELASRLAAGRRAERAGNHVEALAQYRRGLAIDRDNPSLLCEAGWAAFNANDPEARAYLEAGAALMRVPARKAACLYNLGRFWERQASEESRVRAIAAYGDSLARRPENPETRRRYRALAGRDYEASMCPPAQRFASVAELCAAVPPSLEEARASCGIPETPLRIPIESAGPGELIVIADATERADWTTYILAIRLEGGFDVLGVMGVSYARSCSESGVEITGARFIPQAAGAQPLLVVEIHERGEYACGPSPWDTCVENAELEGRDIDACDGEDDDNVERSDTRYRMICAYRENRYRCSVAYTEHGIPPSAAIGPIPEGEALDAMLECPASR